jgi:hypothetical protein
MRWKPKTSSREKAVADGLRRASKFFVFLWSIRAELFPDAFQDELIAAYDPRGQEPCPPALLSMVSLLQRYTGLSDADTVDAAENDRRWQLVLGTLGKKKAPFGQGTLVRFRDRSVGHDLDQKLVDRTVELAKKSKKFDWRKLRVIFDSSPLEGAGRVEDTWNLIGRAMSKVVGAVAKATNVDVSTIIEKAQLTLLKGPSIKAALDFDWSDPDQRHEALQHLVGEAERLEAWVVKRLEDDASKPPVSDALELLRRVVAQDLEPDPDGGGVRIRDGVAEDRVISVGDPEMRHGRKSRSKTIRGFKRHIVIANRIILGGAVVPANQPEARPTGRLIDAARKHGEIAAALADRGYLPAPEVAELWRSGVELRSRAFRTGVDGLFGKEVFKLQLKDGIAICPAGNLALISVKTNVAWFRESDCQKCPLKAQCTNSRQRAVRLHENEAMLMDLRAQQATRTGRLAYRERTAVEHRLARVDEIQGSKARFKGVRKNELDLRHTAAVANLQEIARWRQAA